MGKKAFHLDQRICIIIMHFMKTLSNKFGTGVAFAASQFNFGHGWEKAVIANLINPDTEYQ
jgi:hypothetical protein